jgi:hypothetical protein
LMLFPGRLDGPEAVAGYTHDPDILWNIRWL